MTKKQKSVFLTLIILSLVYFVIFIFPNATGAKDKSMLSLFEPDEYAQISHLEKMFRFEEVFTHTLYKLIAYGHYYYGYPFYFSSFLTLLPMYFLSGPIAKNFQLSMLVLRQIVSIVPMIFASLIMVFTQTKFRSYFASIVTFVFLLSISAVVHNNMWWHPDSLTILFIVLTLFFLDRDQLSYKKNFYFASIACGLATGTKVMGLFFFLTIPIYILMGILQKKLAWKNAIISAFGFVALMIITIIISNPFLLIPNLFKEMIRIQSGQAEAMSAGWTLFYDKGPASWLPVINDLYATPYFFAITIIILLFGIVRNRNRNLSILILSWIVPLSSYFLFFVALKPSHFFLPIVIPLFSCIAIPLEALGDFKIKKISTFLQEAGWKASALGLAMIAVIGYQTVINISHDIKIYNSALRREQQNPSLDFYTVLEADYLNKIPTDKSLVIYRDVRIYFPEGKNYKLRTFFNTVTYAKIEDRNPDLIILWQQRINDYTREGAAEDAIDPAQFKEVERFFTDAKNNTLNGYRLIYANETGQAFASNELFQNYFQH